MKTGRNIEGEIVSEIPIIILMGLEAILKRISFKDMVLYISHNPHNEISASFFTNSICFNLFSEYGVGKLLKPIIEDTLIDSVEPEKYIDNIFYKEIVRLSPEIVHLIREKDFKKQFEWSYNYAIKSYAMSDDITYDRFSRLFPLLLDNEEGDEGDVEEVEENMEDENMDDGDIEVVEGDGDGDVEDMEEDEIILEIELVDENEINGEDESSNEIHNEDELSNEIDNGDEDEINDEDEISDEIEICVCNFCKEFGKYCMERTQTAEEIIIDVINDIQRNT